MHARPLLYRSFARFVTRGGPTAHAAAAAVALAMLAGDQGAKAQAADGLGEPAGVLSALGFDREAFQALERGDVLSRGLEPTASGEIAVAGAILVNVPRRYFVERLKDIVAFKRDDAVLEIGLFGSPPALEELGPLTLSADDLQALERCRLNDCALKLSAQAIDRFGADIDWQAPDANAAATAAFKTMLLDRTRTFLAGGIDALQPYADGRSQPISEEVRGLVAASTAVFRHAPAFRDSLEGPPHEARPGVEALTYWSKEKAAFKPIIALTHMSFYTAEAEGTTITFSSSVNFYSSHYLDASIGATLAVEPPEARDRAVYLIYVNRSRVDALHGLFSGLRRWGVQREARGGLKDRLEETKRRLETSFAH